MTCPTVRAIAIRRTLELAFSPDPQDGDVADCVFVSAPGSYRPVPDVEITGRAAS